MVRVKVPATSANMGPGFDTMGIAFNLYNEYEFSEEDSGLFFDGIPEEFCNEDNIIYKAMIKCFQKGNYKFKGLKIKVIKQCIPIARGLGSSSSCIIAGLLGANYIMGNRFSKDELLDLGVNMEGHPDNIAPALLGGMIIAIVDKGKTIYNKINIKEGIKFTCIIPDFKLSTKEAREVLPKEILLKDAIYNIGRASLMASSFSTGNYRLLKFACKDRLHQNYRSKLIKYYDDVYNKCYELDVICCFLSGAGPTIMCIVEESNKEFLTSIKNYLKIKKINWGVKELLVNNQGAMVIEGDLNK
ncbi:homoserine kinase [Clostridium carnis]